jgi:RNA 3'-terminal phosphate cyclase (ATP)
MFTLDGGEGEGGGQILRTALACSLLAGEPLHIRRIRAGRAKPGLLRQHLTATLAAAEVGEAQVEGAHLGSTELRFTPRTIRGGERRFAVGTAGSAGLVLQTVLPPLLKAPEPSVLVLEGGTHNPSAPPFDALNDAFVPALARLGATVSLSLARHGFFPAGGGRFTARITPSELHPTRWLRRGALLRAEALVLSAKIPPEVGLRALEQAGRLLDIPAEDRHLIPCPTSQGPGLVLMLRLTSESGVEVLTTFGEKGVRVEELMTGLVEEARAFLAQDAPVGEHLADQLLLPLVMAGGGELRVSAVSSHTRTNAEVLTRLLGANIRFVDEPGGARVVVEAR